MLRAKKTILAFSACVFPIGAVIAEVDANLPNKIVYDGTDGLMIYQGRHVAEMSAQERSGLTLEMLIEEDQQQYIELTRPADSDALSEEEIEERDIDQEACGVWLCLPMGFALPGCHSSRVAMYKRLIRGKSPAPSMTSCTNDGSGSEYDLIRGRAAFVPPDKLVDHRQGCDENSSGEKTVPDCVESVKTYQMLEHGRPFGAKYYDIAGGVMIDKRDHCDGPEETRHASCFDVHADEGSEGAYNSSINTVWDRSCVDRPRGEHEGWCYRHVSADYCALAENYDSTYCYDFRQFEERLNRD